MMSGRMKGATTTWYNRQFITCSHAYAENEYRHVLI